LHLLLVYVLDLLILILDYGDVLFLTAGLITELGCVLLSAFLVFLLHLFLLGLGMLGDLADLVAKASVLNADSLGLLLKLPLFCFELGHKFDVIADNLVVEDLLVLELCHKSLDFLCDLEEAKTLLLFIGRLVISQVHKDGLIMDSLILDLLMKGIHFLTHLGRLVVWKVDSTKNIRGMHVIVN
jgi:hypothetical protein